MKLEELNIILEAAGYPVAYSHFVETDNEPLPVPPFICYTVTFSANFSADNKTYKSIENVQIELYTDRKNLEAEAALELLLIENDLPYGTTETFIDSEQLYQKIYEVRLF
jgi:hypothetical protein